MLYLGVMLTAPKPPVFTKQALSYTTYEKLMGPPNHSLIDYTPACWQAQTLEISQTLIDTDNFFSKYTNIHFWHTRIMKMPGKVIPPKEYNN